MRLTLHADYALRTLMFLGLRPGRLASVPEIAAAYRISENHLTKVVHRLGRAGFIETLRGRGGGIRLARAPYEIRLGEVVRCTEDDLALLVCFGPDGKPRGEGLEEGGCIIAGACRLRSALAEALGAFMAVLDGKTLADLLAPPVAGVTAARLGLPEPALALDGPA
ncbi:MAG: Rrf2 family transcriptional regulator [Acetobacteraceae bacterium]|nr:Rrf2 family transcriptional regulator [Acetobacteraceae bacterium]MDI3309464.1 Rrf2 family transcriptional regulator [Acetobacteraceae bacterium]